MAGTEHTFQTAVIHLAARVIFAPHRIRAFDRSRNNGGFQHLSEANRGVRKGTPDVELLCAGRSVNVELKAPGTRHLKSHQPSDAQREEMALLRAAGAYADVAWSCVEVVGHWRAAGVPLTPGADAVAAATDASLAVRLAAPKKKRAAGGFGAAPRKPGLRAIAAGNALSRRMLGF